MKLLLNILFILFLPIVLLAQNKKSITPYVIKYVHKGVIVGAEHGLPISKNEEFSKVLWCVSFVPNYVDKTGKRPAISGTTVRMFHSDENNGSVFVPYEKSLIGKGTYILRASVLFKAGTAEEIRFVSDAMQISI